MEAEINGSQSTNEAQEAKSNGNLQQGNQESKDAPELSQEQIDLSTKLAQIAKRDRFLTQRERKIAESEKRFQDQESNLKGKYSRFEGLDEIKNPAQILQKLGYTIDDILEASLSDDLDGFGSKQSKINPEVDSLKAKLKEIEDRFEKTNAERKKDDEERQISYQKNIIQNMIGKNAEKFPYVNQLGTDAVNQIWDQVMSHLNETGEVMDYMGVIEEVENTAIAYLQKFKGIDRFKKDMGFVEQIAAAQEKKELEPDFARPDNGRVREGNPWEQEKSTTLTNSDESDGRLGESFDSLDEEELLRSLASTIKWDRQE